MSKNLLDILEESFNTFSKGQKKIADYIINNYDKAAFMTAAKLGKAVGVSESTVVRFVVELGYEGYPELKKDLQQLIKNKLTSVQRVNVYDDRLKDEGVLKTVLNSEVSNIMDTFGKISEKEFNEVVKSIINAKNIYILGARSASILSSYMYLNLNLVFDNVKLIEMNGTTEVFEQLLRVTNNDVVIGISFPRYSQKTVKALKFAQNRGARVIAITDSLTSPLVEYSSNVLIAKSDMVSFVDSLVAPMSLINALIVGITNYKRDEIIIIFKDLEEIYDEYNVYDKNQGI